MRRISYANVVSTLALFVALGGVGYAAGVVPFATKAGYANRAGFATTARVATFAGKAATAGTAVASAFAKNAAQVNHISASRSPRPGQLLVLGANAKLPGSVLPLLNEVERDATGRGFAAAFCKLGEIVTGGGGSVSGGVISSNGPHKGSRGNLVGWALTSSDRTATVTTRVLCATSR
jgi:hypothetical protein